jgi:amino acid transporter
MFWNLNSFDAAASFASETTSVGTTFPRGMFIGLAMCVFGYLVPLLVAVGATDYSQADWVDGFLEDVAVDIAGEWLGVWTVFAAGISNIAMFEAEMSSDSYQLMGMGKSFLLCIHSSLLITSLLFTNNKSLCLTNQAERGYVPNIFTTRSKFGTPTAGIIFNTLVIIVFSCADFGQLLELLNSVYSMALLLEYAAFVKLRLYHKECKFFQSFWYRIVPYLSVL